MSKAIRYAVSSGDGNDGVSHMFPDYTVVTDEPWLLAKLAATTTFKPGRGRRWCRDNLDIDGEAEFTIHAVIHDPPGRDGAGWSEANGAWQIWEIFPVEEDEHPERPSYDSLDECFSKRVVAIERRLDK